VIAQQIMITVMNLCGLKYFKSKLLGTSKTILGERVKPKLRSSSRYCSYPNPYFCPLSLLTVYSLEDEEHRKSDSKVRKSSSVSPANEELQIKGCAHLGIDPP